MRESVINRSMRKRIEENDGRAILHTQYYEDGGLQIQKASLVDNIIIWETIEEYEGSTQCVGQSYEEA